MMMKINKETLTRIIHEEVRRALSERERGSLVEATVGDDVSNLLRTKYNVLSETMYEELNAYAAEMLVGRPVRFLGGEYTGPFTEHQGVVAAVNVFEAYDDPTEVSITLEDGTAVKFVDLWSLEFLD